MSLLVFGLLVVLGTPEVQNGLQPESAPISLILEEDLRIGPDDGESFHIFTGGTVALDVDRAGNMLVLDPTGERILRFDPTGNYLGQIGSKGRGPGEFINLATLQILNNGHLVTMENVQNTPSFSYFDSSYSFKNKEKLARRGWRPQSLHFAPDGKAAVGMMITFSEQGLAIETAIFDEKKDIVHQLSKQPVKPLGKTKDNREFWIKELARYMTPSAQGMGIGKFSRDGKLYTAMSNTYEITRWNAQLERELVFERDYTPQLMDENEKRAMVEPLLPLALSAIPPSQRNDVNDRVLMAAIELAGFKDTKHPIHDLVPMEQGRLMVIHQVNYTERTLVGDVFNSKGKFEGSVNLPYFEVTNIWCSPRRLVFRNNYLYVIESNEDDEYELVRYRYRLESSAS